MLIILVFGGLFVVPPLVLTILIANALGEYGFWRRVVIFMVIGWLNWDYHQVKPVLFPTPVARTVAR